MYHDCDEATLMGGRRPRRLFLPRGVYHERLSSKRCPNVSQPDRLADILVDLDCPFGFTHAGDG